MSIKLLPLACIAGFAAMTAGCGEFIRQDRSSVTLVIDALEAASGAVTPPVFSGTLNSDVLTRGGIISDSGRVTMRVIAKDIAFPVRPTNTITITRYLVKFRRTDGRNTPGVDVPQPFDSAVTFTVASASTGTTVAFELIRHTAKLESPLLGLRDQNNNINWTIIATLADVTFFGRDQAGNEVSATGTIGVQFGDFADPAA
jgi:hypothetical protein